MHGLGDQGVGRAFFQPMPTQAGPDRPLLPTGPRSRYGVWPRVFMAQSAISSLRANQTPGLLCVGEEAVEHAHTIGVTRDTIMERHHHHPAAGGTLLVELIEL